MVSANENDECNESIDDGDNNEGLNLNSSDPNIIDDEAVPQIQYLIETIKVKEVMIATGCSVKVAMAMLLMTTGEVADAINLFSS